MDNFPINRITSGKVSSSAGKTIDFNFLMLIPPFQGSSAFSQLGITNDESYINVDDTMRVIGLKGVYAVGDCVNFRGPKLGHMAVRQAETAAENLIAEINGHEPASHYAHEIRMIIDEGGGESLYMHKALSSDEPSSVRQGRFWAWAKRAHEKYWNRSHS